MYHVKIIVLCAFLTLACCSQSEKSDSSVQPSIWVGECKFGMILLNRSTFNMRARAGARVRGLYRYIIGPRERVTCSEVSCSDPQTAIHPFTERGVYGFRLVSAIGRSLTCIVSVYGFRS